MRNIATNGYSIMHSDYNQLFISWLKFINILLLYLNKRKIYEYVSRKIYTTSVTVQPAAWRPATKPEAQAHWRL